MAPPDTPETDHVGGWNSGTAEQPFPVSPPRRERTSQARPQMDDRARLTGLGCFRHGLRGSHTGTPSLTSRPTPYLPRDDTRDHQHSPQVDSTAAGPRAIARTASGPSTGRTTRHLKSAIADQLRRRRACLTRDRSPIAPRPQPSAAATLVRETLQRARRPIVAGLRRRIGVLRLRGCVGARSPGGEQRRQIAAIDHAEAVDLIGSI
jgi:hypothetical protein